MNTYKPNDNVLPLCMDAPEIIEKGYNDTIIKGVTYRVWSAFEDKVDIEKSLSELMLRQLESDDEPEETEGIFIS